MGSFGEGVALFEGVGFLHDLSAGDLAEVGAGAAGWVAGLGGEVFGEVGGDFAEGVEDDGGFLEGDHVVHGLDEGGEVVVEFSDDDVGGDADSLKRAKVAANHGR